MRLLWSFGRATGRVVLRPIVWGTMLTLASVVLVSLAIARYVIAPAIFASDDSAPVLLASSQSSGARAVKLQKPPQIHNWRAPESDTPVKITLVRSDPPLRKWRRHRRHVPDVVYHAPERSPSFGDSIQKAESPDRNSSGDETPRKDGDVSGDGDVDKL